jgi:hypothetical protein
MSSVETEAREAEVVAPEKPSGKKGKPSNGTQALATRPPTVEDLMSQALAGGADIETLERLFALRQQIKAEQAREAFFTAFAEFQAECPVIKKTKWVKSTAGNNLYAYAPLDSIVKQVGEIIAKHGFSYTIKPFFEDATDKQPFGRILATVKIQHSAGHIEESTFPITIKEPTQFTNGAQQSGTALTYAKRYAFCAGFGIVTEDDDTDGVGFTPQQARAAKQPVRQPQQTPSAQKKANGEKEPKEKVQLEPAATPEEAIDANTVKGLTGAMKNATLTNVNFTERFTKLGRVEQVKKADARAVMSWIADPVRN